MAKPTGRVDIPPPHVVLSTIDRLKIELKMARQLLKLSKMAEERQMQLGGTRASQQELNHATSR